jgi:hypothetical protein
MLLGAPPGELAVDWHAARALATSNIASKNFFIRFPFKALAWTTVTAASTIRAQPAVRSASFRKGVTAVVRSSPRHAILSQTAGAGSLTSSRHSMQRAAGSGSTGRRLATDIIGKEGMQRK